MAREDLIPETGNSKSSTAIIGGKDTAREALECAMERVLGWCREFESCLNL